MENFGLEVDNLFNEKELLVYLYQFYIDTKFILFNHNCIVEGDHSHNRINTKIFNEKIIKIAYLHSNFIIILTVTRLLVLIDGEYKEIKNGQDFVVVSDSKWYYLRKCDDQQELVLMNNDVEVKVIKRFNFKYKMLKVGYCVGIYRYRDLGVDLYNDNGYIVNPFLASIVLNVGTLSYCDNVIYNLRAKDHLYHHHDHNVFLDYYDLANNVSTHKVIVNEVKLFGVEIVNCHVILYFEDNLKIIDIHSDNVILVNLKYKDIGGSLLSEDKFIIFIIKSYLVKCYSTDNIVYKKWKLIR